uniref:Uncharacterized protein n=1 Tax=Arundo donax TaxID=35708 RepID=A0A0A9JBT6_ARUDO
MAAWFLRGSEWSSGSNVRAFGYKKHSSCSGIQDWCRIDAGRDVSAQDLAKKRAGVLAHCFLRDSNSQCLWEKWRTLDATSTHLYHSLHSSRTDEESQLEREREDEF